MPLLELHGGVRRHAHTQHLKVLAAHELGDAVHLGRGHLAAHGGLGAVVDDVHGLLQVQLAQAAVGLTAVKVVDAIGHVGGLLRLEDHCATHDGVHGTRPDVKEVTSLDGNEVLQVVPATLFDHLGKLITIVGMLTDDDLTVLLGIQNVPAFGLTERAILVGEGIVVVGMHLDGEALTGIKYLDEQREAIAHRALEQLVVLVPQLREGHTVIRAAIDLAVPVWMGGDTPALSHWTIRQLVTKFLEPPPAPNIVVQDRLQHNQARTIAHRYQFPSSRRYVCHPYDTRF